jgi:hypothetical protein
MQNFGQNHESILERRNHSLSSHGSNPTPEARYQEENPK